MSDAPARRVRNAPAPPPQQVRSKRHLTGRVAKESARGNVLEKAEFSAEIINGAQTQLETEQIMDRFPHDIKSTSQIEDKITFLRISSRTEHVRSLALAYAFTVEAKLNYIYKSYIDSLRSKRKRKNSKTTDFHLVVEQFISYGDNADEEGNFNARKLYNRDVQAIKYLINQNIPPDQVEEYAKKSGQGLDAWARALNPAASKKATENAALEELPTDGKSDASSDKNDSSDSTSHHTVTVEKLNLQIKDNFSADDQSLRVTWINPDGLINELVVGPQNRDDYDHLQELLLELDAIYSRITNNLS